MNASVWTFIFITIVSFFAALVTCGPVWAFTIGAVACGAMKHFCHADVVSEK